MKVSKITTNFGTFIVVENNDSVTTFKEDPANADYQAYSAWLAEGNEPLPADEARE